MQNRIRARVLRSNYLSLLSCVEPQEAKPLQGEDNRCTEERQDSDSSTDFPKISASANRTSHHPPRPVR